MIASVATIFLAACGRYGFPPPPPVAANAPAAAEASTGGDLDDAAPGYRLGSGDKLRVIVFAEEDLSGEFEVDGTGRVSLPLIGQIRARGKTVRELEAAVEKKLSDGYLKAPRVNVEVLNYRPFYIIGEVEKGGEYPFASGIHVLNAVAMAGGYTYRANSGKVFITRLGEERDFPATPDTLVQPGDVIRVPERFF